MVTLPIHVDSSRFLKQIKNKLILIILLFHLWLLSRLFVYSVLSASLSVLLWERGPIRHRDFYLWAEGPGVGVVVAGWHQHQTPVKQKQIAVMYVSFPTACTSAEGRKRHRQQTTKQHRAKPAGRIQPTLSFYRKNCAAWYVGIFNS